MNNQQSAADRRKPDNHRLPAGLSHAKSIGNAQSSFSIVTPSFNQLDWLRLCVASVRDQAAASSGMLNNGFLMLNANPKSSCSGSHAAGTTGLAIQNPKSIIPPLAVEHIIQDAGSPGIEEFAREVGADFYRDRILISHSTFQIPNYSLAIFSERDEGMYDAINRGLAKSSGGICAWLNCDEQYLPGTLGKVAKIFSESPDLDVLLGDALLVDSTLQPVCYRRIMVPNRWHTRLDHLHSLSCAMFFRRSALPSPPLDPRWKVIGDAVLMDHFLGSRKNIRACGDLLSAYAFTGANLSADPAHNEHAKWLQETKWPPGFLRPLVVLQNRLRRMAHGAYGSFRVEAGLFSPESLTERAVMKSTVPGTWPDLAG